MKASDNSYPSVLIRESANDGSDFSNPSADYRRLFLGEDGQLHVKDSAGTVTAIGASSGGVATDAIWTTAGKVARATGTATATEQWPPGHELDYVAHTAGDITVSGTTEGAGSTVIVTSSSVTFDGDPVIVEVGAMMVAVAVTDHVVFVLYDNTAAASLGKFAQYSNPDTGNVMRVGVQREVRITPAAGARVLSWRAFRVSANGTIGAGAGGSGNTMPAYMRITKA